MFRASFFRLKATLLDKLQAQGASSSPEWKNAGRRRAAVGLGALEGVCNHETNMMRALRVTIDEPDAKHQEFLRRALLEFKTQWQWLVLILVVLSRRALFSRFGAIRRILPLR